MITKSYFIYEMISQYSSYSDRPTICLKVLVLMHILSSSRSIWATKQQNDCNCEHVFTTEHVAVHYSAKIKHTHNDFYSVEVNLAATFSKLVLLSSDARACSFTFRTLRAVAVNR